MKRNLVATISHAAMVKKAADGIVKTFETPLKFMGFMSEVITALGYNRVRFRDVDDDKKLKPGDLIFSAAYIMEETLKPWMEGEGEAGDRIVRAVYQLKDMDSAESWRDKINYMHAAMLVDSTAYGLDTENHDKLNLNFRALFELARVLSEIERDEKSQYAEAKAAA